MSFHVFKYNLNKKNIRKYINTIKKTSKFIQNSLKFIKTYQNTFLNIHNIEMNFEVF